MIYVNVNLIGKLELLLDTHHLKTIKKLTFRTLFKKRTEMNVQSFRVFLKNIFYGHLVYFIVD